MKKILIFALMLTILISIPILSQGNNNLSDWAKDDITSAIMLELCPNNMFDDYKSPITRVEFCELAFNLLQSVTEKHSDASSLYNPFEDTDNHSVNFLHNMDIIKGNGENIFAPNDILTREEAATVLYRMYGFLEMTDVYEDYHLSSYMFYDDAEISDWAHEAVYNMRLSNIMNGVGDDLFGPKKPYSVEQAIVTMVRLYNKYQTEKPQTDAVILPAIEVKGNYISPADGVDIDHAKDLIEEYLRKHGTKGDINQSIKVEEITISQAWENNKMQIYSVELDYAWIYGVAIISENEVVGILTGMPTTAVYLADIDNDGKYEVCTNAHWGSGWVDERIHVLDVDNVKQYSLSKRFEYDLPLEIDESSQKLVVYKSNGTENKTFLGELRIIEERLTIVKEDGSRIYNAIIIHGKSDRHSSEELSSALACIREKFKDFEGCELIKLWYDEEKSDEFIKGYMSNGNGAVNGVDKENVIVLLSDFYVNPIGSDGSFNPDSIYSNWNWILIRDSANDEWIVDDWGY